MQTGRGRPMTLPGPLGNLVDVLGGVGALREAPGNVDPSTPWRWAHTIRIPERRTQVLLVDHCRRNGIQQQVGQGRGADVVVD